eukprot:2246401-Amphidinium_carterae.1
MQATMCVCCSGSGFHLKEIVVKTFYCEVKERTCHACEPFGNSPIDIVAHCVGGWDVLGPVCHGFAGELTPSSRPSPTIGIPFK